MKQNGHCDKEGIVGKKLLTKHELSEKVYFVSYKQNYNMIARRLPTGTGNRNQMKMIYFVVHTIE